MAEIDTIRSVLMKLLDFVETLFVVVGHLILATAIISAVAGAECNTVIELKLEHHAA